jgi:hypothetical protein
MTEAMTVNAPDGTLLLYCLGVGPSAEGTARPPELTASDWDVVLRQAAANNVIPLLYHQLKTRPSAPPVPPVVLEQLRDVSFRSAANSLRVARELSEMLDAFRSQGIAFVVLKGAHLGQLVYSSSALRTMCDLDVLVRRPDLDRAVQVLADLTYAPQYFGVEAVDYAHHHHLRPMAKLGGIRVELHWGIAPPSARFEVDIDGLWDRAQPAQIAGIDALTLSPEDLILHLCLHASFSHKFRVGLRACWDIFELIRHYRTTVDWDEVVRRAQGWRIDRYVYLTLRLVREMFGAEIPPTVIRALEPPGFTPEVVAWARTCIFAPADDASVSRSMAELWTSRRLSEKFAVLRQTLYPSRAAMGRIYQTSPDSRGIYLYYPRRWVDLLLRYGRYAWGLWRGDDHARDELRAASERAALREWLGRVIGFAGCYFFRTFLT